jgi:hypothetical protein
VARLGETGPVDEPEVTEAEVAAVMAEDAPFVTDEQIEAVEIATSEPFVGYSALPALADLPAEEQAAVEAVLDDATPFEAIDDAPFADAGDELFEEPDALTAKIQSAIVEIAPSPPAHPDETDAPEMTDEQVETLVLERMEAPPVPEPTVEAYINPAPLKKLFPWAT